MIHLVRGYIISNQWVNQPQDRVDLAVPEILFSCKGILHDSIKNIIANLNLPDDEMFTLAYLHSVFKQSFVNKIAKKYHLPPILASLSVDIDSRSTIWRYPAREYSKQPILDQTGKPIIDYNP